MIHRLVRALSHTSSRPLPRLRSRQRRGSLLGATLMGTMLSLGAVHQAAHAAADTTPTLCIWDPIGAAGPLFDAAKSYALAAQQFGTDVKLKSYTDERVASEDFRVGQCSGLMATSLRTKHYLPLTAATDYGGAATIVRDGKIDMDASYDVVRKAVNLFASPAAAKLVVHDRFELGGILPTGSILTFVRDRNLFKKGFTGARLPAFDDDKVQAYLIQRIGAQAVSSDINNFVTKFNNGNVDALFAPAVAFRPLEIYRGVGTQGGVSRFPLAFTTIQLVLERSHFPAGFAEKSRQYWAGQFDQAVAAARKAEADIPANLFVDFPSEEAVKFVAGQRDTRLDLAEKGFYDKQGLKIMKRIRCNVHAAAAECTSNAEVDWNTASAAKP